MVPLLLSTPETLGRDDARAERTQGDCTETAMVAAYITGGLEVVRCTGPLAIIFLTWHLQILWSILCSEWTVLSLFSHLLRKRGVSCLFLNFCHVSYKVETNLANISMYNDVILEVPHKINDEQEERELIRKCVSSLI